MILNNRHISNKKLKIKMMLQLCSILPLLLLAVVSCTRDEDMAERSSKTKQDSLQVSFSLELPSQSSGIATYAMDQAAEDDIETIDVLAFKIDGDDPALMTFDYRATGSAITDDGSTSKKKFTVTLLKSSSSYRFVVLANARNEILALGDISKTAIKDELLSRLTFKNAAAWKADGAQAGEFTPIPMWGETPGMQLTDASQTISSIKMLRMAARIDVTVSTDQAKAAFLLRGVYLYNRKTRGYIVPQTANWDATALSVTAASVPPDSDPTDDPLTIKGPLAYTTLTTADVAISQSIYTFEAAAVAADKDSEATCLVIGGIYSSDTEQTYYRLDFVNTDKTAYRDILRNHLYKVNITKVAGRGYPSLDDAFKSKPLNMEVEIVQWDQAEMTDITFDGQYMMGVSKSAFNVSKAEVSNGFSIQTDYPDGWTAKTDADWLSITSPASGTAGTQSVLNFKVAALAAKPEGANERTGHILITAGRMTKVITVIQSWVTQVTVSLSMDNIVLNNESEIEFSQDGQTRLIAVEWTPSDVPFEVVKESLLAGGVEGGYSISVSSAADGQAILQVTATAIPASAVSSNPILERQSKLRVIATDGAGTTSEKYLVMRQIHYGIVVQDPSYYLMNGATQSLSVRSNTPWTVTKISDAYDAVNTLATTGGGTDKTDQTQAMQFQMKNNTAEHANTVTLRFTSTDGKFEDKDVTFVATNVMGHNSYMVQPGGSSISIPVGRANSDGVIRLADLKNTNNWSAELLWKDNASMNVSVSSSGKNMIVSPGSVEGNVLVAVRNTQTGLIVWSYHIWVTTYDPNNGGTTYSNPLSARTPTFMDRNLGALSANVQTSSDLTSRGLLYQWGRKDPFPGAKNLTQTNESSDSAPIYTASGSETAISIETVQASPTYYLNKAVENPMTFYTGIASNSYDWYSRSAGARNDNLWQDGEKTVYDPCPEGWRVPASGAGSQSAWYAGFTTQSQNSQELAYYLPANLGTTWITNAGYNFQGDTKDGNSYHLGYYPTTGNRGSGTGLFSAVGANGYSWSSSITGVYGYGMGIYNGVVGPSNNYIRSFGFSVRCVKE